MARKKHRIADDAAFQHEHLPVSRSQDEGDRFLPMPPAVEPCRRGRTLFPGRQPSRRKALSLEARNYTATIL
jgi:hypothetical protein